MKLPRVLGLDLDGTIINQGQPVDQRIIHAIIHSNFDKKILATARALRGVKKVAGDLLSFCDLILCNGAITIPATGILNTSTKMDPLSKTWEKFLNANPQLDIVPSP